MKVLYIARTMPHYRERISERLGKLCNLTLVSGGVRLGLGGELSQGRIIDAEVKVWPSPFGRKKLYWQPIWRILKEEDPDVVISEFGLSLMHTYVLYFARVMLGFKLAYWTHGLGVEMPTHPLRLHERIRLKMLDWADGVFFYTGRCKAVYERLGGRRHMESWVVWNTLDTVKMNEVWAAYQGAERLHDRPYVVYMGRLVAAKRCEELLELGRAFKLREVGIDIIIIGNGEMENELRQVAEQDALPLVFKGAILDDEIKVKWLQHSLSVVCLGGIGLNVVDAFGFGAPMIGYAKQTEFSKHGPEVEYLNHGENGWLMSQLSEVVDKIIQLYNDPIELERVRVNARVTFEVQCDIERQIEGFEKGLKELGKK